MRTRNVVARLERLDWGELPPPGEKRPPTAFEQRRRETLQQAALNARIRAERPWEL